MIRASVCETTDRRNSARSGTFGHRSLQKRDPGSVGCRDRVSSLDDFDRNRSLVRVPPAFHALLLMSSVRVVVFVDVRHWACSWTRGTESRSPVEGKLHRLSPDPPATVARLRSRASEPARDALHRRGGSRSIDSL